MGRQRGVPPSMSGPFQRILRRGGERPEDRPEEPSAPPAEPAQAQETAALEPMGQETAALEPVDQPTEATEPLAPQPLDEQPTTVHPPAGGAVAPATSPEPVTPPLDEQPTTIQPAAGGPVAPVSPAPVVPAAPGPAAGEQPTTVQPAPGEPVAAPVPEQPAEPRRPGFRERGRLRRRLRYLRKLRELQVRDLGGLVFDLRRFERKRDDLVAQKIDQIRACDSELRALEAALDERRDLRDVHEPGIGGTCPRCFALYGSNDRFCANCGAALGGAVQGPAQVTAAAPAAPSPPPPQAPPAPGAHPR
jgi:hypothetical protein